jgi:hypothetical protein
MAFRLLLLDVETTPVEAYVWRGGKQFVGPDQIKRSSRILCFAAKWYGEAPMITGRAREGNDREQRVMVKQLRDLIDQADAVAHYNGKRFDMPRIRQEIVKLGLKPPSPVAQIDLYETVSKTFDLPVSNLKFVAPYFRIGKKIENEGWPLWLGCMANDAGCWRRMTGYNKQDTRLLEPLYKLLLPYIQGHPNLGHYSEDPDRPASCPKCGSTKLRRNGVRRNRTMVYRRYVCSQCGSWCRSRHSVREHSRDVTVVAE